MGVRKDPGENLSQLNSVDTFFTVLNRPGIQSLPNPSRKQKTEKLALLSVLRGNWHLKVCGRMWDANARAVLKADGKLS